MVSNPAATHVKCMQRGQLMEGCAMSDFGTGLTEAESDRIVRVLALKNEIAIQDFCDEPECIRFI